MIKETNVLDGSPMFNSKVFSILIVGLISRLPLCVFLGHWRASAAAMGRVEIRDRPSLPGCHHGASGRSENKGRRLGQALPRMPRESALDRLLSVFGSLTAEGRMKAGCTLYLVSESPNDCKEKSRFQASSSVTYLAGRVPDSLRSPTAATFSPPHTSF